MNVESKIHSHFSMELLEIFYISWNSTGTFLLSLARGTYICLFAPTILYFSATCIFLCSYIKIHWFFPSLQCDKFSTKIIISVRGGFVLHRLSRLQPRVADFVVYAYLLNTQIEY